MAEHTSPAPDGEWRHTGERIEALLAASGAGGALARERSEDLVRLVTGFYGAGVERLLTLLHERGALTDPVADALAGDELVACLLLVHELHPYDTRTRVLRALADVRARLGHPAELAGIDDGVVRLRLPGVDGCGAAAAREAVVEAVTAAAPETSGVRFTEDDAVEAGPLVPVASLFARLHDPAVVR